MSHKNTHPNPNELYAQIVYNDDIGWTWGHKGDRLLSSEYTRNQDSFDETAFEAWLDSEFLCRIDCPYCKTRLARTEHRSSCRLKDNAAEFGASEDPGDSRLWTCPRCAYWQWHIAWHTNVEGTVYIPDYANEAFAVSQLGSFNPKLPEPVASELAAYLRRNPTWWHQMKVKDMEVLVGDIFRHNYEHCDVLHTGSTGDGGKDVLLIDTNKDRWLISAKRREFADAAEGVVTLRELLGAMVLHDSRFGVIASTADHFSTALHKARKAAEDRGFIIQLLDRGRLDRLIGGLIPRTPWQYAIEEGFGDDVGPLLKAHAGHSFGESLGNILQHEPRN